MKEEKVEVFTFTKEQLANYTHTVWSHWMNYLLPKMVKLEITEEDMKRWARQVITPYKDLSEKEKDSDRKVVDKILGL